MNITNNKNKLYYSKVKLITRVMELTVLQEDFQKAVSLALRYVSQRPAVPILSHILLEAKNGQLEISATNLEVGINLRIGASVKSEGKTTVQAKTLYETLSSLPKSRIDISEKEDSLNLVCGDYTVNLPVMPPNDFPGIFIEIIKPMTILKSTLKNIAQYVSFAAASPDARPEYSGILFLKRGSQIDVVATDGIRLSKKVIEGNLGAEKILIPAHIISDIPKVFLTDEVRVQFDSERGQIIFANDNITLISRVLGADFPDFEKIIPKNWETRITVPKEEFLSAVQIASVFAQDYKIELLVSRESISLISENPQLGSQKSSIPSKVEGEEITIAFNARYIREFLNVLEGEEVVIDLTNPGSPGVFHDPKDERFIHLIMPIRSQV